MSDRTILCGAHGCDSMAVVDSDDDAFEQAWFYDSDDGYGGRAGKGTSPGRRFRMSETRDRWADIEAAAKAQAQLDLDRVERTTLEFGAHIAWAVTARSGPTTGLSSLHRVGESIRGEPYTVCREQIPAPVLRLPLSPAIVKTLERCGYCEAGIARAIQEHAA